MIKNANLVQWKCGGGILTRALCTAEAETTQRPGREWRLYKRLSALGAKKGLVGATINEYLREGRVPQKYHLIRCVKELRRFGRHHQALEIMEWMESRNVNFSHADHATRLDLISKTQGIDAAENYFNALPPSAQNQFTYGALLNCYCVEKLKDKALDLFDKMDQLQISPSSLAFNNLMSLYMRLGQPEKVPPLVVEMKKRNIPLSTFTYNIFMHSYSCLDDIEGVERVFQEIMQEGGKKCDWTTFSNLAVAYVDAGFHDKAVVALKKVEREMGPRNRDAFHYMLTLYARTGDLAEVHRIWKSLKSSLPTVTNLTYLTMLQALNRLNDIDELKNCFREWESTCTTYDIRLANLAIGAYLRHGMVEDAESVLHSALERSTGPFSIAREMLMMYYLESRRNIRLARQYMEAAISGLNGSAWQPKSVSICKFLTSCEEEKDVDGAEEFCKYLKRVNCINHSVYKSLLQTYVAAGKTAPPNMRTRIERDGIEICPVLEDLLQDVSPE